MSAAKNNKYAKKEITASDFLHIRVKVSDKEKWLRKANDKMSTWVVDTLNAKCNEKTKI